VIAPGPGSSTTKINENNTYPASTQTFAGVTVPAFELHCSAGAQRPSLPQQSTPIAKHATACDHPPVGTKRGKVAHSIFKQYAHFIPNTSQLTSLHRKHKMWRHGKPCQHDCTSTTTSHGASGSRALLQTTSNAICRITTSTQSDVPVCCAPTSQLSLVTAQ